MEIDKHPRRPMNHSTSETKGRAETDLLFADELEIQCVAQRSAVVPSKAPRALAVEQIELIPILPIDEENARRFPVETNLLSNAPLRVVPAKERSSRPALEEWNRPTPSTTRPRIARPQRRWLVRVGALSVIAGFAIGWLAGRPLSGSLSQARADAVLPSPVGESPLGTSGLQRDAEKPAPPPAPRADDSVPTVPAAPASAANSIARKEADVVKPTAVFTPSPSTSRPEAAPAPPRVDPTATAPAPVPLKEMPVAPAPREPAVEKPLPPPTSPAAETPVATSPATRPPVPERTASPVEPVNETAAVPRRVDEICERLHRPRRGSGDGRLARRGPGGIEESLQRARCAAGDLRSLRRTGHRRGRARDVCRHDDVASEDRRRERPRAESHLELRLEECRGLVADREGGSALTD